MIKRIIEISKEPAHLSVDLDQLRLKRPSGDASIPCEDIGVLLVEHPETTCTNHALAKLVGFGAAVVVCGRNHLPAGILLPFPNHTEVVWRVNDQIEASRPLKKHLWKQLVVAKIHAQARNLPTDSPAHRKLRKLARDVKSGDPSNVEAQAARTYWASWLGEDSTFRRDPDGDGVNALLNYGYAVLRAAVARAVVAAGILPVIGIHHSNRSNLFCLADDLLEPLRPLVDAEVQHLHAHGNDDLDRYAKASLLSVLHGAVQLEDQTGPLMVALHRMAASLVRCYRREEKKLLIPTALRADK